MKIVPKKRKGRLPLFGRCCDQRGAMVEVVGHGKKICHRYRCSFCGNEWLYRVAVTDKDGNYAADQDDSVYGYYGCG